MPNRPTKTRRRFETDRVVRRRRARLRDETPGFPRDPRAVARGRLASTDPWDCGRPACGICNPRDPGRRARERAAWRADWEPWKYTNGARSI